MLNICLLLEEWHLGRKDILGGKSLAYSRHRYQVSIANKRHTNFTFRLKSRLFATIAALRVSLAPRFVALDFTLFHQDWLLIIHLFSTHYSCACPVNEDGPLSIQRL
jgi:hypothetical protein